jgi:hypothetical protein
MITVRAKIPTKRDFWRAVALFAYRRWASAGHPKPVGIPGNRDPEHPCTGFEPRRKHPSDWGCQSDGHYPCEGCCHRDEPEDE